MGHFLKATLMEPESILEYITIVHTIANVREIVRYMTETEAIPQALTRIHSENRVREQEQEQQR